MGNNIILNVGEAFRLPRDGKPVPYNKRLDRTGQALNDVSFSILAFKIRKPFLRFFELNVNFFAYLNCGIFIEFLD